MNKLVTTALVATASCAIMTGCGGNTQAGANKAQAEAEKTVMSFVDAYRSGDFEKAGKLLFLDTADDSQSWAEMQMAAKMLKDGTADENLKQIAPTILWLAWDLEPIHGGKIKSLLQSYNPDEETKAEMAVKDVTDMRAVPLKATLKPEYAKQLGERAKEIKPALVIAMGVKHKGVWKTGVVANPVEGVDPDNL